MATLSKPPIPLKMYKHFAIMTVTLTASIAMFADEDKREAAVEQLETRQVAQSEPQAKVVTDSQGLVRNDLAQPGSGFGTENRGYGGPTVRPASVRGTARPDPRRQPTSDGRLSVPGYDQAWIDAMSPEQYRIFLESISEEALDDAVTAEDRRRQQSALEAASARRAGRSGPSADAPPS